MSKRSEEEARRQLEADEQARQAQSHGAAWKSGQTIADPPRDNER